jgi:hypothetical protein
MYITPSMHEYMLNEFIECMNDGITDVIEIAGIIDYIFDGGVYDYVINVVANHYWLLVDRNA